MATVNTPDKSLSAKRAAPVGSSTGQRVPSRNGHSSNISRAARTGPDQGACDQCYRLKVKCDRLDPLTTCNRCQEHDVPCTRSLGRRPPGKPKGSKNKPKNKVGETLQKTSNLSFGHDGTISIEFAPPKRQTQPSVRPVATFGLEEVLDNATQLPPQTHATLSESSIQSLVDWRGHQQPWDWPIVAENLHLLPSPTPFQDIDLISTTGVPSISNALPTLPMVQSQQPSCSSIYTSNPQTPVSEVNLPGYPAYIAPSSALPPTSHPQIKEIQHSINPQQENIAPNCTGINSCLCNSPFAFQQISSLQPLLPQVPNLDEPLNRAAKARTLLHSSLNCVNFQSHLNTSVLGGSSVPLQMCLLLINVLLASYKKIYEAGPSLLGLYPVEWACIEMSADSQKKMVFDILLKSERRKVELCLLELEQWTKTRTPGNTTGYAQIQAVKTENGL